MMKMDKSKLTPPSIFLFLLLLLWIYIYIYIILLVSPYYCFLTIFFLVSFKRVEYICMCVHVPYGVRIASFSSEWQRC